MESILANKPRFASSGRLHVEIGMGPGLSGHPVSISNIVNIMIRRGYVGISN
jgi:hypothetical protein